MALQIRRGTNAERLLITPLAGELIYTTDTKELWLGDGTTLGGVPAVPAEQALDVVAPALVNGTHTNIAFTYDDPAGTINAVVSTNVVDDASPQLGGNLDLNENDITGTGNINITGDVEATTIVTNTISPVLGTTVSLSGSLTATSVTADLVGSVFSDDSTTIVNGVTGEIYANNIAVGNLNSITSNIQITNDTSTAISIVKSDSFDSGIVFRTSNILGQDVAVRSNGKLGAIDFQTWKSPNYSSAASINVLADGDLFNSLQPTKFEIKTQSINSPFPNVLSFDSKGVLSAKIITTGSTFNKDNLDFVFPGAIVLDEGNEVPKFVGCVAPASGTVGDPEYVPPVWVDLNSTQITATNYETTAARDIALPEPTPGTIIYNADLGRFQGFVYRNDSSAGEWIDLNI